MKIYSKILSFLLCCVMVLSLSACNGSEVIDGQANLTPPTNSNFWGKPDDSTSSDESSFWDTDLTPNINITVIGGGQKDEDMSQAAANNVDIEEMVTMAVQSELKVAGYNVSSGIAYCENEEDFYGIGLYYYSDEFDIFQSDEVLACGFTEILQVGEEVSSVNGYDVEETIYIMDISDADQMATRKQAVSTQNTKDLNEIEYLIYAYNYENIVPSHFVYKNYYVTYYMENEGVVRYSIQENIKENYDLSLGSIYDYDNNQFIYDTSIFGEYKNHSAVELFGEENYTKLENELQVLSELQLMNGYEVSEFNIIYISPESIQAYLSSEEEDTFFGYDVDELAASFGLGTALIYNGGAFEKSTIITEEEGYNWKSFLIKCGIGCGIILVGAILSPITGGASFGCALLAISKVAVSFALTSAISTLAAETISGLIQGMTIEDALQNATHRGLDAFANHFMIGAAIGSVGVVSGIIKPSACFVTGTAIAMLYDVFKPIESICVGDYVLSYNESDRTVSRQKVIDTFSKYVYQTIGLTINGEYIETTYNHPFYSPIYNCWVEAGSLVDGDYVLDSNGNCQVVQAVKINNYDYPVIVYNFTVENNHTYYVGENEVLVHNKCATEMRKEYNSTAAQKKAVKDEILAIRNGTSKNTYPKEFVKKLTSDIGTSNQLTDAQAVKKYAGEFAAHHIVPIDQINKLKLDPSLVTDKNNLLVLQKNQHSLAGSTTAVHQVFGGVGRGTSLAMTGEYFKYLCKLKPAYSEIIIAMAKLAGVLI